MSTSDTNPYQVLGVSESSTNDEIKAAYLRLAKEWHPDVNHSTISTDKFRAISSAYESLKNESARLVYHEKLRNDSMRDYNTNQKNTYGNANDMWKTSAPGIGMF